MRPRAGLRIWGRARGQRAPQWDKMADSTSPDGPNWHTRATRLCSGYSEVLIRNAGDRGNMAQLVVADEDRADSRPLVRPLPPRAAADKGGSRGRQRSEGAQISFSKVAWVPEGELAQEEWITAGRRFGAVARCCQWWIGDWLLYASQQWGEKYVEAAKITRYDIGTLRNYAWVASQFDPSLRSDTLSWSHHALLAPLDGEVRVRWIARAEAERLSVADLRIELRASKRGQGGGEPAPSAHDHEEPGASAKDQAGSQRSVRRSNPERSLVITCPHCGGQVETGQP